MCCGNWSDPSAGALVRIGTEVLSIGFNLPELIRFPRAEPAVSSGLQRACLELFASEAGTA
jgi:hypothetical protein